MGLIQCPQCTAVVQHDPGVNPVCPTCGFGAANWAPAPGYARPRADGMAIASMVLGICGVLGVIGLLASIAAIVLGTISLRNIQANPALAGKGMATTGIVLGCVFLAMWLLMMPFWMGFGMWRGFM